MTEASMTEASMTEASMTEAMVWQKNSPTIILTTDRRTVWDFRYIPSHLGAGLRAFQQSPKSLAHVWESIVNFGYVE
jgi:hypothetical protein